MEGLASPPPPFLGSAVRPFSLGPSGYFTKRRRYQIIIYFFFKFWKQPIQRNPSSKEEINWYWWFNIYCWIQLLYLCSLVQLGTKFQCSSVEDMYQTWKCQNIYLLHTGKEYWHERPNFFLSSSLEYHVAGWQTGWSDCSFKGRRQKNTLGAKTAPPPPAIKTNKLVTWRFFIISPINPWGIANKIKNKTIKYVHIKGPPPSPS